MGPSPAKPGSEKCQGAGESIYYGVYLPPDVQTTNEDTDTSLVFTDKSEALKLVKKYKKARFKSFRNRTDAMQFAVMGLEPLSSCPTSPLDVGEKPSPFRGPKPQDMVRFRKAIEAGDLEFVKKTAWENPRYLVSSGDTPAILQEGSRYNALHIGAKSCNAALCAFVLQTISSHQFMRHFYGDSIDTQQRCDVLIDLYLNTPDKALNETPLHFASKYGAARVVQVLVAYPQCDRRAINKHRQTPKDVICTRLSQFDTALKEEISFLLDEQFYVPVLRSPDNSIQPVVGEPFSPTSPVQQEKCHDVISPVLEVQALAGPMPKQTAELFRRRWKTPPRIPGSPLTQHRPTLIDQDKGWEKVGRELAQEWKVPWKEYWPFLNAYIDLNSNEGLQMLEEYLHNRFKNNTEDSSLNNKSESPPNQMNGVANQESPMSELCNALRACRLSSGGGAKPVARHHPPPRPTTQHNGHARQPEEAIPSSVTSPHLYMEKSCQVFAKRIVDGFCLGDSDLEFLWTEMKHLNILVSSCLSDNRFAKLDFQHLHSRLAHLIAQKLDLLEISKITDSLQSLVNRKSVEYCSSDEEELIESPYSRKPRLDRRDRQVLRNAVICVTRAILNEINNRLDSSSVSDQSQTESEQACAELWARAGVCSCNFFSSRNSRKRFAHKKLVFNDDDDDINLLKTKSDSEDIAVKCNIAPADSSGEESDTSDTSDHEFFTPPSSPGVRSDDDLAMESPDEGPDVYINGNTPCKLDIAVMEAIKGSELNKGKFPNICRWRHLVLLHSEQERHSWISSPMHKSSFGTPSQWHRAPSLNFD